MANEKFPFFKNEFKTKFALVKEWKYFEGEQGCTRLDIEGLSLRMDKSPPPLPSNQPAAAAAAAPAAKASAPAPSSAPPPPPKPAAKEPLIELFKWATAKPAAKEEKSKEKAEEIKPFDLYDIPQAMEAEGFSVGAKLSRRWLNGRAYSAYTKNSNGQDVEGRYDEDMIDTQTVKLDWLRKLPAIEARYQEIFENLWSEKTIDVIKNKLRTYVLDKNIFASGDFNALDFCKNDYQDLHNWFQFQLSGVSMFDTLIGVNYKNAERYLKNVGMSDVTASLANFAFYAAIAKGTISRTQYNRYNTPKGTVLCVHFKIKITHIYVYARDSYSFYDKGNSSQYLGHWNKTGLVIMKDAALASWGMKKIMDPKSHEKNSIWDQKIEFQNNEVINNHRVTPQIVRYMAIALFGVDVYYPVRNRDYREWREKKGRGGDFLIYSDLELVRLSRPMEIDLGGMCF